MPFLPYRNTGSKLESKGALCRFEGSIDLYILQGETRIKVGKVCWYTLYKKRLFWFGIHLVIIISIISKCKF